jgi:hypothetical protein
MIIPASRIRSVVSPLIFILIIFTFLDNYLLATFGFKLKFDELLLFILNMIFLLYIINKIFIKNKLYHIELFLVIFFLVLMISSLINCSNGILQKILGSYFLIKSLNILYLTYRFGLSIKWIKKIFRLIIFIAIISVAVQIIQFIYPNIYSISGGLIPAPYVKDNFIRCTGILGAPNRTAQLYVIAYLIGRLNGKKIFSYYTFIYIIGLFLASSNLSIFSFLMVVLIDTMRHSKKLIFPLSILISIVLSYFGDSFLFRIKQLYQLAYENETYFRLYAFFNSLDVLSNNIFFGVGPGMYGGSVASIMGSPVNIQYHLFDYYGNSKEMPTTIDMFWPHLWAEVGLVGTLSFLIIFIYFYKNNSKKNSSDLFFINLLIFVMLFFGISTFSLESTFASIVVYPLIGSIMYWRKRNVYITN